MNTPLLSDAVTASAERTAQNNAKVAAFNEAVGYAQTDLYDVFSRMGAITEDELTDEQKAKFNKARQRFANCLKEYGLQQIPTDQ